MPKPRTRYRQIDAEALPSPTEIYGRPVRGPHTVAVEFAVATAQETTLFAHGGTDKGDLPYIAVTIGHLLVYVYDQDALRSHLRAWVKAGMANNQARLPTVLPATSHMPVVPPGSVTVLANVIGVQRASVRVEYTPAHKPYIVVTVGAITTRVHTSSALASIVAGWTRAERLLPLLADPESQDD